MQFCHSRRPVIVRMDTHGEQLSSVRVDNDPGEFAAAVMAAPADSDVNLEALRVEDSTWGRAKLS